MKDWLVKIWPGAKGLVVFAAAVGIFAIGWCASPGSAPTGKKRRGEAAPKGGGAHAGHNHGAPKAGAKKTVWYCPMHAKVRQPEFGQCPLCGMDLVEETDDGGGGPRSIKLKAGARALAEIAVRSVRRRAIAADLPLTGKVTYDERRVNTITSWVGGRIDKLYIRFTGVKVKRWQTMAWIYSPELVTAQVELIQAARLAKALKKSGVGGAGGLGSEATLQAVREKLRLLGLSRKRIRLIETRGKPVDHLYIYATAGGVVTKMHVREGMYVKAGTPLYTVADLRRLWVKLDVYEAQLHRVKLGQTVLFEADAYPGEKFEGKVSFIDPYVTDRTRTIKVRVAVKNPKGRLKPDMLVKAVLKAPVGPDGRLLTKAEDPLVIPTSAPLITGKRALVYVEKEPGLYEGRPVVLGPRVGEYYIVREGLKLGDKVVVQGAFKIDSALQLKAKVSMMNPADADHAEAPHKITKSGPGSGVSARVKSPKTLEVPTAFRAGLDPVLTAYYAIHLGLSKDDLSPAKAGASRLNKALGRVWKSGLSAEARQAWRNDARSLQSFADGIRLAADLAVARLQFDGMSATMIAVLGRFGSSGKVPAIRFNCSMAFGNKGGDWLQPRKGVENPYWGAQMFTCGSEIALSGEAPKEATPAAGDLPAKVDRGSIPPDFYQALDAVLAAYFAAHLGLSKDSLAPAKTAATQLGSALPKVPAAVLVTAVKKAWDHDAGALSKAAAALAKAADISAARREFLALSAALTALVKRFGTSGKEPVYRFYCSMAFDNKGGHWLQARKGVENPYYGSQMYRCGEQRAVLVKKASK